MPNGCCFRPAKLPKRALNLIGAKETREYLKKSFSLQPQSVSMNLVTNQLFVFLCSERQNSSDFQVSRAILAKNVLILGNCPKI